MKVPVIITGFIVALVHGISGQEIFRTTLDNRTVDLSQAILQTTDRGYIIAGETYSTNPGTMKGLVVKYDAGYNVSWKKEIGAPGANWLEIYDATETNDQAIILTGREQSEEHDSYDLLICKLSQHGDLLWKKRYGGPRGETGYKVIPASGNGIMVAGITCSGADELDKMLVTRFDSSGNLLWANTFGEDKSEEAYNITQLHDGGFLLIGACNTCQGKMKSLSLIKMDEAGSVIWKKIIESGQVQVGFNAVEDRAGNILISGISKKVNICRNNLMITQLSPDGGILWTKEIEMDGCVGKTCLVMSEDNGFIVSGTLFNFKKDISSIFLMKFRQNGKQQWTKMVGGMRNETCNAMIINGEKELVMAGEITGNNQETDILVVKARAKKP